MSAEQKPEIGKWEYLFINCSRHNNSLHAHFINGKEIKKWNETVNIYEYSNMLGNDGWELIGTPSFDAGRPGTGVNYTLNLVFKRFKI